MNNSYINRIILGVLSAVALFMFWQHQNRTYENKGRLNVSQQDGAVVLKWQSAIRVPMERRFEEAYQKWRNKTDRFIIILDSPGGALREGGKVIEVIQQMRKTHEVVTKVEAGKLCASMCVPIYIQGETRIAAATSRWMFHEPISVDYFSGDEVDTPQFERRALIDRFYNKYFATADINAKWRDHLKEQWVDKEIWKTGAALVAENSGIIQELR